MADGVARDGPRTEGHVAHAMAHPEVGPRPRYTERYVPLRKGLRLLRGPHTWALASRGRRARLWPLRRRVLRPLPTQAGSAARVGKLFKGKPLPTAVSATDEYGLARIREKARRAAIGLWRGCFVWGAGDGSARMPMRVRPGRCTRLPAPMHALGLTLTARVYKLLCPGSQVKATGVVLPRLCACRGGAALDAAALLSPLYVAKCARNCPMFGQVKRWEALTTSLLQHEGVI
jgi:hypothetical protein